MIKMSMLIKLITFERMPQRIPLCFGKMIMVIKVIILVVGIKIILIIVAAAPRGSSHPTRYRSTDALSVRA